MTLLCHREGPHYIYVLQFDPARPFCVKMASLRTDWNVHEVATNLDGAVVPLETERRAHKPASEEIDVSVLEPRQAFETFAGQRFEIRPTGELARDGRLPARSSRLETPLDKFIRLRGET